MLKYIIALLGLCVANAEVYNVHMTYVGSKLTLTIPTHNSDVRSVLFFYGLETAPQTAYGTHTDDGWEFTTVLKTITGDKIYGYADIFFANYQKLTTKRITLNVGSTEIVSSLISARRIRAVSFRDDFNNYNTGNWHPEVSMFGGYNWEFQVYTPEAKNIYVANGNLYLRPTLTTDDPRWDDNFLHTGVMDVQQIWGYCTNSDNAGCHREGKYGLLPPVMSGKLYSNPTLRFGTLETRARIPRGDWLWPAIWMMPKNSVYGEWPRSGEIDIMESRGNTGDIGISTVSTTLHWGPDQGQNRYMMTHGEKHGSDFHADFHTYRLDWTESYIRTFVDNQPILDVEIGNGFWAKGGFSGGNIWAGHSNAAPFDQDFFLMYNVAVGGTSGFFPDNYNYGVRKPWANNSPDGPRDFWNGRNDWLPSWQGDNTALQVDYVEFRN